MKTRPIQSWDIRTGKPKYGIQVRIDGKWLNAAEGDKPLLFDTEIARDAKRKDLSKIRL